MVEYEKGDILDTNTIYLNRFEIIGTKKKHIEAAESIRIMEVPEKGKPVAVIEDWGDGTGNKNDLLNGHL